MPASFRVYNHSDRDLVVQVSTTRYYRLLPQCISPEGFTPVHVWAANHDRIDGSRRWTLTDGFDAHVYQVGIDNSIGSDPGTLATRNAELHISGLHLTGDDVDFTGDPLGMPAWFWRSDEVWVTVLGAGVTGLTVAHELVTRGFRVQVIERAHGSPTDAIDDEPDRFRRGLVRPDVGGIARTQWSTQPLEAGGLGGVMNLGAPLFGLGSLSALRSVHGDALWFGATASGPQSSDDYYVFGIEFDGATPPDPTAAIVAWLDDLTSTEGRSVAAVQLVVVVYGDGDRTTRLTEAYARHQRFTTAMSATLRDVFARLQVMPTARLDVPDADPGGVRVGLLLRVHEDLGLVAGEHGFRFFPGFYRHLRDTMQRTPIFDPVTQTFTPRTALDNLQEVDWQVIADPARKHETAISRRPFDTIGGLIEQYKELRRDSGYRPVDLLRYALRMLRYMTSSTKRRHKYYEDLSWWDFVSKRHLDTLTGDIPYGQRFKDAIKHAPKALIAMEPEKAEARTLGNINVQLLMDQFGLHDQSDSTLMGPTSVSWLRHWRSYLEQQGVRFFLGEVTELSVREVNEDVERLELDIVFPGATPAEYLDGESAFDNGLIRAHYIVSALDLAALANVTRGMRRLLTNHIDIKPLLDSGAGERDIEDITQLGRATGRPFPDIGDRFQTLTGIQFYYRHHISFANGHIYFATSPWGLSAISQVQFWGPFGSGHRGRLTGNLSVDIGSWRAAGTVLDPNTLTRDSIAQSIAEQIDRCTNHGELSSRRSPTFYHLDDFIGFATGAGGDMLPSRNHAPFLINIVGDWKTRPRGEPWSPNDVKFRDRVPGKGHYEDATWYPKHGGYPVHYDTLVIAGTHARTYTRLGTMESANESARHAVNSILDHATMKWPEGISVRRTQPTPGMNVDRNTTEYGDYCDIWNPEECEFQDLDFLRLIDKHLMASADVDEPDDLPPGTPPRRAPHLFDILKIDDLPDLIENDEDATRVLELVGSTLKAFDQVAGDDVPGLATLVERVRRELTRAFSRP